MGQGNYKETVKVFQSSTCESPKPGDRGKTGASSGYRGGPQKKMKDDLRTKIFNGVERGGDKD